MRRHELLASILVSPDDRALRMVYADLLTSEGDPRGELIAIELAEPNAERRARRRELRETYGALWWPGIPTWRIRTRFGFVESIAIRADELDAAIALAEPIRELELMDPFSHEQLWRLPPVSSIVLRAIDDGGWRAFLESDCAETVRSIDLGGSEVSELALVEQAPACRRLSIAQTWIAPSELSSWEHLERLCELDLSLPLDAQFDGLDCLERAKSLRILRANCGQELELPKLPDLERLEVIGHDDPSDELVAAFAHATVIHENPERVTLDLGDDVLTIDARRATRDDEPYPLDVHFTQSDSIASTARDRVDDPDALDLLVLAIGCGAPRAITVDGCELEAAMLPRDSIVTATLVRGPTRATLALEHYVD